MTPLGWGWAALVWGYALAWFLLTDPVKLLAYRYLDATKSAAPKRQDKIATDAAKSDCAKPARLKAGDVTVAQAKAEIARANIVPARVVDGPYAKSDPVLDMKLGDLLAAGRANGLEGAGPSDRQGDLRDREGARRGAVRRASRRRINEPIAVA